MSGVQQTTDFQSLFLNILHFIMNYVQSLFSSFSYKYRCFHDQKSGLQRHVVDSHLVYGDYSKKLNENFHVVMGNLMAFYFIFAG